MAKGPDVIEIIVVPQGKYDPESLPPQGVVVTEVITILKFVDDPDTVLESVRGFIDTLHGVVASSDTIPPNVLFVACNCDQLAGDYPNVKVPATRIADFIDKLLAEEVK